MKTIIRYCFSLIVVTALMPHVAHAQRETARLELQACINSCPHGLDLTSECNIQCFAKHGSGITGIDFSGHITWMNNCSQYNAAITACQENNTPADPFAWIRAEAQKCTAGCAENDMPCVQKNCSWFTSNEAAMQYLQALYIAEFLPKIKACCLNVLPEGSFCRDLFNKVFLQGFN